MLTIFYKIIDASSFENAKAEIRALDAVVNQEAPSLNENSFDKEYVQFFFGRHHDCLPNESWADCFLRLRKKLTLSHYSLRSDRTTTLRNQDRLITLFYLFILNDYNMFLIFAVLNNTEIKDQNFLYFSHLCFIAIQISNSTALKIATDSLLDMLQTLTLTAEFDNFDSDTLKKAYLETFRDCQKKKLSIGLQPKEYQMQDGTCITLTEHIDQTILSIPDDTASAADFFSYFISPDHYHLSPIDLFIIAKRNDLAQRLIERLIMCFENLTERLSLYSIEYAEVKLKTILKNSISTAIAFNNEEILTYLYSIFQKKEFVNIKEFLSSFEINHRDLVKMALNAKNISLFLSYVNKACYADLANKNNGFFSVTSVIHVDNLLHVMCNTLSFDINMEESFAEFITCLDTLISRVKTFGDLDTFMNQQNSYRHTPLHTLFHSLTTYSYQNNQICDTRDNFISVDFLIQIADKLLQNGADLFMGNVVNKDFSMNPPPPIWFAAMIEPRKIFDSLITSYCNSEGNKNTISALQTLMSSWGTYVFQDNNQPLTLSEDAKRLIESKIGELQTQLENPHSVILKTF